MWLFPAYGRPGERGYKAGAVAKQVEWRQAGRGTTLGMAVCVPLTGPRPFDVEAQAQLNVRF
jgi:hypothetical protein